MKKDLIGFLSVSVYLLTYLIFTLLASLIMTDKYDLLILENAAGILGY